MAGRSIGMDSPDDFAGRFLLADARAFGKICGDHQAREFVRDVGGDVEYNVGSFAGAGLHQEPVFD